MVYFATKPTEATALCNLPPALKAKYAAIRKFNTTLILVALDRVFGVERTRVGR